MRVKMLDSKLVKYLWLPISIILNAVSIINLQKDLLPAIYSWGGVFETVLRYFEKLKNILFYPVALLYELIFGSSIPSWITTYLMIGLIFSSIIILSIKDIRKSIPANRLEPMPFYEIIGFYLAMIVVYPPFLIHTLFLEYDNEDKRKGKSIIFKYFIFSLIVICLAIILNTALSNKVQ